MILLIFAFKRTIVKFIALLSDQIMMISSVYIDIIDFEAMISLLITFYKLQAVDIFIDM